MHLSTVAKARAERPQARPRPHNLCTPRWASPTPVRLTRPTRFRLAALLSLLLALGSGCAFFEPHKVPIQQGNLITSKALSQLKLGMSKEQVSYVLGTPLSTDTFDPDVWIYSYTLREDTEITNQRHVKLRFENDSLITIDTDGIAALGTAKPPSEAADRKEPDSESAAVPSTAENPAASTADKAAETAAEKD